MWYAGAVGKKENPKLSPKQVLYLEHFALTGHHGDSARVAGVNRRSALRWRQPGEPGYTPGFPEAYEEAERLSVIALRDQARKLAMARKKPNTQVLLRLLEAHDPAFRQKRDVQLSGDVGLTVKRLVFKGSDDDLDHESIH